MSLPTNIRRPGAFSSFVWSNSLLGALNELNIVIVAEKTAAGTAPSGMPIQVFSEIDADTKAGVSSLGALGCRKAFEQGKISEGMPAVYLVPLDEASGGAKATYTITITATSAAQDDLNFTLCGRPIAVPVNAGDTATDIAVTMVAAILALGTTLPFSTVTNAAGVVTLTFATKGVNGNGMIARLQHAPTGVTFAFAAGVAGTGAIDITDAVQSIYDKRYNAVAVSNHATADIAILIIERGNAWGYNEQNYRHYFMGENGSLGTAQALATAANDFGIVVGTYQASPSLPLEIAVCDMFAEFATTQPNVNMDGQMVALYPPDATDVYGVAEIESALGGGMTPHVPDAGGVYSNIVRMMTTEVTLDGVDTEVLRDIAYTRTAAYRAELHEDNFKLQFPQGIEDDETTDRVRAMQIAIDRGLAAATPPILRDVESKIDQYQVSLSADVPGRVVSSSPFTPAGPLHQLDATHILYF